jgi:hypothetical protein
MERPPTTGLWIVALLLASASYAVYSTPEARDPAAFALGVAIGKGLPILVVALVPALIVWAIARFRQEKIRLFLSTWAASLAVIVVLAEASRQFGIMVVKDYLADPPASNIWTDRERADFVKSWFDGCTQNWENSELQQMLVDKASIDRHCLCMAAKMSSTITMEEVRYLHTNDGLLSPSAKRKAERAATHCNRETKR